MRVKTKISVIMTQMSCSTCKDFSIRLNRVVEWYVNPDNPSR
nr:MAG TPA: hypothetical protein [Caudoviricetes sp.]